MVDENGRPMITDFGQSRMMSYKPACLVTNPNDPSGGSTRWMAYEFLDPSVVSFDGFDELGADVVRHTKETDMWAFGMVIYVSCRSSFVRSFVRSFADRR